MWTARHPQPRLGVLSKRLAADTTFRWMVHRHKLTRIPQVTPARMYPLPGLEGLQKLETVRALADWLRLDPEHLFWFADLADRNGRKLDQALQHYHVRIQPKPDGSRRVLEVPKARLKALQRQIHREILAQVPLHPAVHGFRQGRSIVTFAAPHCGKDAVLRLDLQDFFPSISGPRVQALFRTLGYPEPVADLLGGLCTATTPKRFWSRDAGELSFNELEHMRTLYARPHLPQGAPSSPALANLCAFRLDLRLTKLAQAAGAEYTRYADDLAFSGDGLFASKAPRLAIHVAAIALEEGFHVQHRKTRLMRNAVRQHLAGLSVNRRPNLSRRELDRLEAILTNCVRYGPQEQNRDSHPDFRRHLEGRVAFAVMVNGSRAEHLQGLLRQIRWTEDGG